VGKGDDTLGSGDRLQLRHKQTKRHAGRLPSWSLVENQHPPPLLRCSHCSQARGCSHCSHCSRARQGGHGHNENTKQVALRNLLDDEFLAHVCGPQGHLGASESLAHCHAVEVAGEFNLSCLANFGRRHGFQEHRCDIRGQVLAN